MFERLLEQFLFRSRWLLAPFYVMLIVSLCVLLLKAGQETIHFVLHALTATESDVILGVLALVDLTLTGSYRQGLDSVVDDPDGWTHEMVGRLCILNITDDDEVAGDTVAFSVEVEEASGAVFRDELQLSIFKDPRNL